MIDGPVKVAQVVHGYRRGHRELVSSSTLDNASKATMLGLSDLLGVPTLAAGDSYLTAYPLRTAASHVFARTWAAGPKLRPGSVWTHSLIVSYSAMSRLDNLEVLLPLLRFPADTSLDDFAEDVDVDLTSALPPSVPLDEQLLAAMGSVYGTNASPTAWIASAGRARDEALLTAIWAQMWPALRRDCAFLSLPSDQSIDFGASCTLRVSRSPRGPDRNSEVSTGLFVMAQDIVNRGDSGLRSFLSTYIPESASPRESAPILAAFFSRFQDTANGTNFVDALETLSREISLPRLLRDTCSAILARTTTADEVARVIAVAERLEFSATSLGSSFNLDAMQDEQVARLIRSLDGTDRAPWIRDLRAQLTAKAPVPVLLELIDKGEPPVDLVAVRPELAYEPELWPKRDWDQADLLRRILPLVSTPNRVYELLAPKAGTSVTYVILSRLREWSDAEVIYRTGSSELKKRLREWILGDRRRFFNFLPTATLGDLVELAQIHMHSGVSVVDAYAWADVLMSWSGRRQNFPAALILLGYVSALGLDRAQGLSVARRFLPELIELCRQRRVEDRDWSFLQRHVPGGSYKWSQVRTLYRSAQLKWAGWNFDPTLLSLFSDFQMASEFLEECESIVGPRQIAAVAQRSRGTGIEAKLLKKYLSIKP